MRKAITRLLSAIILTATACTSAPPATVDPLGAAPPDFSIDLTVLNPVESDEVGKSLIKSSHYVLLSDGSLHHGRKVDGTSGASGLPPLQRILSRGQMAEVWSLAQQLGFADPASGQPPINFNLIEPAPDEVVTMAGFSGFGRSWSFVRRTPRDQPPDPAMSQLVEKLNRLGWVEDQREIETAVAPKRYDFGPDPYVRYRKP